MRDENTRFQAELHPMVNDEFFPSVEAYVNHLIHRKAYEETAALVFNKTVLDVGCNVGYGVQLLANAGATVSGVDVSPQAVKVAKERLGTGADIRLYDGKRSNFAAHSFDVVTSFQVIEHISDYDAYFAEIARVLRADGIAIFTTPNRCLRLDSGMKPWNPFHVREFGPKDLRDFLLERFKQVEVRGLFGQPDIHNVEVNRLHRSRIAARSRWTRFRRSCSKIVKKLFPRLVPRVRRYRSSTKYATENARAAQVKLGKYNTRDLFYAGDGLENALDLMAVCRNPKTP
jgi:SAM-dependent methyltransferase